MISRVFFSSSASREENQSSPLAFFAAMAKSLLSFAPNEMSRYIGICPDGIQDYQSRGAAPSTEQRHVEGSAGCDLARVRTHELTTEHFREDDRWPLGDSSCFVERGRGFTPLKLSFEFLEIV